MNFSVRKFNAKGDGTTDDTGAFQSAIDACRNAGGGTIIIEEGIYSLGAITLYSHVHLYLEKNAILKMSSNLNDFDHFGTGKMKSVLVPTWDDCDYDGKPTKYFIYAYQCEDISITGEGAIDGNEEIFYGKVTKWHIEGSFYPRVPMIYFEDCKKIELKDITLKRSAFWTVHLVGCEEILIDHIEICNNLRLTNCDGIDPDHCKHMVIRNCRITSADDCIVFKTTSAGVNYGVTEDITVSNCELISTSAAIKFGSESVSDFKDIHIHDCVIRSSNRGISLQLRDEGSIDNCSFKDITIETRRFSPIHWWGKGEPIAITAVRRTKSTRVGSIRNVSFENVTMDAENGIYIYGMEKNIRNIAFRQCSICFKKKTDWEKDTHDLRPCEEIKMVKEPMNVVYVYGGNKIFFGHFSYQIEAEMKKYLKQVFMIKNSSDVELDGSELRNHIHELHTTRLGEKRILENTGLSMVDIQKMIGKEETSILQASKNYYVFYKNVVICIHKKSYTVITANELR